mmetsp:Transcript_68385/g.158689  ORF Transcript_68385/g.158689 Transcript_68385/m.158689 type:complete len:80 (-) Transcript_68385:86-325(-)
MALAEKVGAMDLEEAQATSLSDAKMIREQVRDEMGSFQALNQFVCHEVQEMLVSAERHANQRFADVLAHLESVQMIQRV